MLYTEPFLTFLYLHSLEYLNMQYIVYKCAQIRLEFTRPFLRQGLISRMLSPFTKKYYSISPLTKKLTEFSYQSSMVSMAACFWAGTSCKSHQEQLIYLFSDLTGIWHYNSYFTYLQFWPHFWIFPKYWYNIYKNGCLSL